MCEQIAGHWQEHHKRLRMDTSELQQYRQMNNGLKFEVEVLYRRPVEVIARDIHGNDYVKGFEHIPWHGLKRISHVAEAIFRIAQCNNGAEIRVSKETQLLSYDELLEDLCDPHRQVELSIVINHSNQQWQ